MTYSESSTLRYAGELWRVRSISSAVATSAGFILCLLTRSPENGVSRGGWGSSCAAWILGMVSKARDFQTHLAIGLPEGFCEGLCDGLHDRRARRRLRWRVRPGALGDRARVRSVVATAGRAGLARRR